jgi:hypothetical protein
MENKTEIYLGLAVLGLAGFLIWKLRTLTEREKV